MFACSTDDQVNFRQFVRVLSIFRPIRRSHESVKNTTENKLRFAFQMYDLDQDDKVSAEEILTVLQMMVGVNISDEQVQRLFMTMFKHPNTKLAQYYCFGMCRKPHPASRSSVLVLKNPFTSFSFATTWVSNQFGIYLRQYGGSRQFIGSICV